MPALYRKLRAAVRKREVVTTPVPAGKLVHGLEEVEHAVALFAQRDLISLLRSSGGWDDLAPWCGAVHVGVQSVEVEVHAKTFGVDRRRVFVGSFNFDPRSMRLNTEMGLVVESADLAGKLAAFFDDEVPRLAYEVRLAPDGRLSWIERSASGEQRFDTEPGTSWFRRATIEMMSILPIEWLL